MLTEQKKQQKKPKKEPKKGHPFSLYVVTMAKKDTHFPYRDFMGVLFLPYGCPILTVLTDPPRSKKGKKGTSIFLIEILWVSYFDL